MCVTTAQTTLDRATVRVATLRTVQAALERRVRVEPRVLADFTDAMRSALIDYEAARDDLDAKAVVLNDARDEAFETYGVALLQDAQTEAQAALDMQLEGADYDEALAQLQTALDAALAESKDKQTSLADFKVTLANLRTELAAFADGEGLVQAAIDAAADLRSATDRLVIANNNFAIAANNTNNALTRFNSTNSDDDYARYQNLLNNSYLPAVAARTLATDEMAQAALRKTQADAAAAPYVAAKEAVDLALGLSDLFVGEAEAADAAALAAEENVQNLTDLNDAVVEAGDVLLSAQAKVGEDEAVMAARGAVNLAEQTWTNAVEYALSLLEGSEEEAAAKAAIVTAQQALDVALGVQAKAVAAADAAVDGAKAVVAPEVTQAVAAIGTALGEAETAEVSADKADALAETVLADHKAAQTELLEQLIEDKAIKFVDEVDPKEDDGSDGPQPVTPGAPAGPEAPAAPDAPVAPEGPAAPDAPAAEAGPSSDTTDGETDGGDADGGDAAGDASQTAPAS